MDELLETTWMDTLRPTDLKIVLNPAEHRSSRALPVWGGLARGHEPWFGGSIPFPSGTPSLECIP